jgi:hypothetical protein
MFLSNVCWLPPDYTALLPRRQNLSCSETDPEEVKWTEITGFCDDGYEIWDSITGNFLIQQNNYQPFWENRVPWRLRTKVKCGILFIQWTYLDRNCNTPSWAHLTAVLAVVAMPHAPQKVAVQHCMHYLASVPDRVYGTAIPGSATESLPLLQLFLSSLVLSAINTFP